MSAVVEGIVVKAEAEPAAIAMRAAVAQIQWSREQVELIKRTVCPPDTTDDELKLFMHVAKKSGLDPLQKQIHCTKRGGRLVIIAGIDGLQARAAKEADYEGILHGVVCAKDEFLYDATTGNVTKHTYNAFGDRGPIMGAWSTVRRKGLLPFTALVKFTEFNAGGQWQKMPHVMIDKVARSTALRMAYPEQFSSIYEQAEMDQAETAPEAQTAQAKTAKKEQPKPAQQEAPKREPDPIRCAEDGHRWSLKGVCEECGAKEKQAPKQPPQLRARAIKVWKEAQAQSMDLNKFQAWTEAVLGRKSESASWTEDEIAHLEVALQEVKQEPGGAG